MSHWLYCCLETAKLLDNESEKESRWTPLPNHAPQFALPKKPVLPCTTNRLKHCAQICLKMLVRSFYLVYQPAEGNYWRYLQRLSCRLTLILCFLYINFCTLLLCLTWSLILDQVHVTCLFVNLLVKCNYSQWIDVKVEWCINQKGITKQYVQHLRSLSL